MKTYLKYRQKKNNQNKMAHEINISVEAGKEEKYTELLPQIGALIGGETDRTANLANIAAALKETFGFFWVGFYLKKEDRLVLGPFQGPPACSRIAHGRGVCGTTWKENKTLLVPDVSRFPGHIACSSASKSEIVIPISAGPRFYGVLDIDSDRLADFDETDRLFLGKLTKEMILPLFG